MKTSSIFKMLFIIGATLTLGVLLLTGLPEGVIAQGPSGDIGAQAALGTAFTYQGRLTQTSGPVNGNCDFTFKLYNSAGSGSPPSGGSQIGATQNPTGVTVSGGYFSVQLDFWADAFTGEARWLEIAARCPASSGGYTTLSPRQTLTPAPYALGLRPGAVISGAMYNEPILKVVNLDNSTWGGYAISAINYSPYTWRPAIYGENKGNSAGVYGRSNGWHAVVGWSENNSWAGVYGNNTVGGYGVRGENAGSGGDSAGVYGLSTGENGNGVKGEANNGTSAFGVWGKSASGYAGYFDGKVHVAGTLSKSAGSFKIDHPLDPANKYLYHSFVESPDMMNIYNGNVTLDANGEAVVELPAWFEALNQDFRYQLTAIGGPGPGLYIAQEVANNRFNIAGGAAGLKVSWQVTGVRHDPYAEAHRIQVEEDKPATERGTYLYPDLYGQPETLGLEYKHRQSQKPPTPPLTPDSANETH